MNIINIGANSGSNVNEFLYEHDPSWNVTPQMWHEESKTGCGVCGACKTRVYRGTRPVNNIRAIAMELLYINFVILAHNFKVFNVPGVALNAAGGVKMDKVFAPYARLHGIEFLGVSTKPSENGYNVPMVNVDSLMTMFGWKSILSEVDFLSIDTEGHDALVLKGAQTGLQSKTFRVIEFEYHGVGEWRNNYLNNTVGVLMNYGYTCFWQGNRAVAEYEVNCDNNFHKWSNLVCAHESPIVAKLKSICKL
jgi:FkbM family methyltransferase